LTVVSSARNGDGATEHVAEQDHRHEREREGRDDLFGLVLELQQITQEDRHSVRQSGTECREWTGRQGGAGRVRHGRGRHWVTSSRCCGTASGRTAGLPVKDRNTSSSVGWRRPTSTGFTPA